MPSPVLSAPRKLTTGSSRGFSGTAALHSLLPPTFSSFHVCSQSPVLRGFHEGLYFLDILISSPVMKRRSSAGTFLQAGVDLRGRRPKALWVFFTRARHELFRAGSKAHISSMTTTPTTTSAELTSECFMGYPPSSAPGQEESLPNYGGESLCLAA